MATDDADPPVFKVDLAAETERFFDDTSRPGGEPPRFVLLLGGVSSGKTWTRRRRYKRGFVIVDAAEIFISLSRGGYYDFPDGLADPMHAIGSLVALRAVGERRSIVTEMLATDRERFESVFRAMTGAGYRAEVVWIECDVAEAARRNASRGDLDISAAFCQDFHRQWLLAAVQAAERPQ
jgi:hypothetical protein